MVDLSFYFELDYNLNLINVGSNQYQYTSQYSFGNQSATEGIRIATCLKFQESHLEFMLIQYYEMIFLFHPLDVG